MKKFHSHTEASVYTIFADVFMLLFMMSLIMMGERSINSLDQEALSGKISTVTHDAEAARLFVSGDGHLFSGQTRTNEQRLSGDELRPLLSNLNDDAGKHVILMISAQFPTGSLKALKDRLTQYGATHISYIFGYSFKSKLILDHRTRPKFHACTWQIRRGKKIK